MPAKRSSNAKKGNARAAAPSGVGRELLAIAIIVVAAGMAVSLVSPSGAIVTHAMEQGLRLGFGEGALLVPVALALFAVTMFLPMSPGFVPRVAVGLGLIVLALLAGLSILSPGVAEQAPDAVLSPDVAVATGGYAGCGIAWLLLTLVGQTVGVVVLVGFGLAGAVVCGLSISSLVARVRRTMGQAADRLAIAREERASRRAEMAAVAGFESPEPWDDGEVGMDGTLDAPVETSGVTATALLSREAPTSFIGARKTSVLRRRTTKAKKGASSKPVSSMDEIPPATDFADDASAPMTTLLRRRHPALDIEGERPAEPLGADEAAAFAADEDDLPDGSLADGAAPTHAKRGRANGREKDATISSAETSHAAVKDVVPDFLLAAASARGAASVAAKSLVASGRASEQAASSVASETLNASKSSKPAVPTNRSKQPSHSPAPVAAARPGDDSDTLELPPLSLLKSNPNSASSASTRAELDHTAQRLQATLEEFGLSSRVSGWVSGPLVTTFKIEMGEGERVNKITNLEDDIALSLAAESVRIFAPIPGTSLVGIEIPNRRRQSVCLGDVLPYAQGGPLELALGRDAEGRPVVADLASMPHLLIAGATGSGKSVMINSIIMSILMRDTPDQVRLIMIDPKRVELGGYNGLPHLYVPVVTEPRQASSALQWAVTEMDRRLKVFERAGAREIKVYNKMVSDGKFADQEHPPSPMPYLVIIIDELSDLMMVAGKDVEASIVRIAQLARAAGIHLIVATQRPSADVVTGLIKSNIENRIAFSVASGTDSRVILDQTGAERLLGRGDMLFRHRGKRTRRVLGCYVSDPEIESAVDFIREQGEPEYHDEILSAVVPGQPGAGPADVGEEDDPLVWEAAQVVVDSQLGSTSGLQRRLKVGYARAGRIMDNLEQKGVVGPPDGSKPREVLMDADGLEELRQAEAAYREV